MTFCDRILFVLCIAAIGVPHFVAATPRNAVANPSPPGGSLEKEQETTSQADELSNLLLQFEEVEGALPSSLEENFQEGHKSPLTLEGYARLRAIVNYAHKAPEPGENDWRGLSGLREELQLGARYRLAEAWRAKIDGKGMYDLAYSIRGRDEFSNQILDNYESEFEIGEAYLQGSMSKKLDIRVGRQIVAWGKSDNIRVTDVLNSLDLREIGLTDIKDLRLPAAMTRLDYYLNKWSVTVVAVHEVRFNKNPEFGSDFYQFPDPLPPEEKPSDSLQNTQWGVAANGIFSGWDLSLYWADYYNDIQRMAVQSVFPVPQFSLKHDRLCMRGGAVSVAWGSWLWKAEAAFIDGFRYFYAGDKTFSRFDLLGGVEYSGFIDTHVTLEAANRHVNDYDRSISAYPDLQEKDTLQAVLRVTRTFKNKSVKLASVVAMLGARGEYGSMLRLTAAYDLTDHWELFAGLLAYESGGIRPFLEISDNDRIIFEIRYRF